MASNQLNGLDFLLSKYRPSFVSIYGAMIIPDLAERWSESKL